MRFVEESSNEVQEKWDQHVIERTFEEPHEFQGSDGDFEAFIETLFFTEGIDAVSSVQEALERTWDNFKIFATPSNIDDRLRSVDISDGFLTYNGWRDVIEAGWRGHKYNTMTLEDATALYNALAAKYQPAEVK